MKKHRLFKASDVAVYGGLNVLVLGLLGAAVARNWRTLPVPGWVAISLCALGFVGITAYRFWRRWEWVSKIRWYTPHGVAVSFGLDSAWFAQCLRRAGSFRSLEWTIDEAIDRVLNVWPESRAGFDGGMLVILPEVWGGGLRYMGFAQGSTMVVAWDPDRNPGLEGLKSIVSHEAGHVALTAKGVPATNEAQHPLMAEHGL